MSKLTKFFSRQALARSNYNRREVYTQLAQDVMNAARKMNTRDAEDLWLLHDLSGILFTIGQTDPVASKLQLNNFLNLLRQLQGPIRELGPKDPDELRLRIKN